MSHADASHVFYEERAVSQRTIRSFERVDNMPRDLRECVHEFGEPIVQACLRAGVRSPNMIRDLVREIWDGARQPGQKRPTLGSLDWVLAQAGAQISAKTLVRVLQQSHHYIVPMDPSKPMLEASMAEVSNYDLRITKTEKHRRRLRAAIKAGVKHIWGDI